jgi:hypothetical protein
VSGSRSVARLKPRTRGTVSVAREGANVAELIFFAFLAVPFVFLFFVTGKFGPIRLPDTWAKHCESCGKEWGVLHRTRCPRCSIALGKSNVFTTAKDWRLGKEAAKHDPVLAETLKRAAERRKALRAASGA